MPRCFEKHRPWHWHANLRIICALYASQGEALGLAASGGDCITCITYSHVQHVALSRASEVL